MVEIQSLAEQKLSAMKTKI